MPKAHGCKLEHLDVCARISGDFDFFFFDIQNVFIGMFSHSFWCRVLSVLLLSEGASSWKPCFSSCRLSEDSRATRAQNYCLCVARVVGDFIASWASHTHEIGIGALHKVLLLGFPLLLFLRGTKEILCKRHVLMARLLRSGSKILIPYHFSFMLNSPLLGSRGSPSLHWFISLFLKITSSGSFLIMDAEVSANVFVQHHPWLTVWLGMEFWIEILSSLRVSKTWLHCLLVSSPALLQDTFPSHHAVPFRSSLHRQDSLWFSLPLPSLASNPPAPEVPVF